MSKAKIQAVSLGQLQDNAETATKALKSAASKLAAAEQTFTRAEQEHTTAIRALHEGMKAVGASVRAPQ